MQIVQSTQVSSEETNAGIEALLKTISEQQLRDWVEHISFPRSAGLEPEQNRVAAEWLSNQFRLLGFRVTRQGKFSNIIAAPDSLGEKAILVGAHYDSVPSCPGADDNGSAVAAMLGCAAACSLWQSKLPVVFVGFNCEEDGLLGSQDFVQTYLPKASYTVICAHVLEMVGYASSAAGSQKVPTGLPLKISDQGDFLGLLANGLSTKAMDFVLRRAKSYTPEMPVTGLGVKLGLEKYFPVLSRSDHAPFWSHDIPAVMWTDTSEFRNQNYHRPTDTPDTLDYKFLRQVTQLLTASVIQQAELLL